MPPLEVRFPKRRASLLSVAEWLIHLGGWTPDRIARAVLRGVEKGRLYVPPQPEAKVFWALRRLSPRLFLWGARRVHDFALRRAPSQPRGPADAA